MNFMSLEGVLLYIGSVTTASMLALATTTAP